MLLLLPRDIPFASYGIMIHFHLHSFSVISGPQDRRKSFISAYTLCLSQMLIGEKYGPYLLPTEIPAEEFESLILAGRMFREKQMRFIRQSIADIEATRAERDRLRQLEMETASIATTATTTTVDPHNMRSESIVSNREDPEDEVRNERAQANLSKETTLRGEVN